MHLLSLAYILSRGLLFNLVEEQSWRMLGAQEVFFGLRPIMVCVPCVSRAWKLGQPAWKMSTKGVCTSEHSILAGVSFLRPVPLWRNITSA
jgi:hypothetical protein